MMCFCDALYCDGSERERESPWGSQGLLGSSRGARGALGWVGGGTQGGPWGLRGETESGHLLIFASGLGPGFASAIPLAAGAFHRCRTGCN